MSKKYSPSVLLKILTLGAVFTVGTSIGPLGAESCDKIQSECLTKIGGAAPNATWWYQKDADRVCSVFKESQRVQKLCIEKMTGGQWSSQKEITPQAVCVNSTNEMKKDGKCS